MNVILIKPGVKGMTASVRCSADDIAYYEGKGYTLREDFKEKVAQLDTPELVEEAEERPFGAPEPDSD